MLKLYKYITKYKWSIVLVLMFTLIQVMANLFLPNITSDIINKGIIEQNIPYIWQQGAKMLLIAFVGMGATIGLSYFASKVGMGFGKDLRSLIFSKIERFALQDISDMSTASLITRTTNDVQQIQMVTNMILRMAIQAPITAIGGIFLALQKQAQLSLVFVVSVPVLLLGVSIVGMIAIPLFKKVQKKLDHLNLVLREKLTGIRVIRAYNKDDAESQKFDAASNDLKNSTLKVNYLIATLQPFITLMMSATIIAIVWFGSKFIDAGTMLPGDIIAFMQYAMQIMSAFIMLAVIFIMVPRASASADRINEVLDKEMTITDSATPVSLNQNATLEFNNVSFQYPGAEKAVLENISFTAKAGETVAIIGGTGSGKSTLMNLIPRFYDVAEGAILVNGVDIRQVKQEELRNKMGYVPQKNVLFSGTIAENLEFGKPDATIEDMEYAARIAQAQEFINEKPEGFESYVEQGGANFSGGQKQRLSIMRAIIRRPEIYLFDDSFSALDLKTDAQLRAALTNETANAITVIVAQRISSIMEANQIIVLESGKIDAIGTHQELLQKSKVYQEIALSQLSEEELA